MAVVYRGASTPNSTASAATITLAQDIPSLADGDYMLMALYCNSTANGPPQPPAGWTLLESTDGASFFVEVWGRIAASEPGSYTIDRNGATAKVYGGIILAFRSDAALTLYVDDSETQINASAAGHICPGVTTTVTSAGLACFFASSTAFGSTPPGDMTERLDSLFNSGVRAYAMTSILTVAGATGDKVATGTAAASRAVTVAIAELAASSGTADLILGALTLNATGTVAVKGTANLTLGALTLAATGNVGTTPVLGAGNLTLGALTLSAAGTVGPLAPSNLSATAVSASRIDLTWDDDDLAAGSYSVERSANGLTGWAEIFVTATKSYSDTGLAENTTYYYRVRAIKA